MNAETFCEQFATFAESPNGVAKLRELILQLAVQGKLGTHDVNDEPASELLRQIDDEKIRLGKLGKLKSPSQLPPVDEREIPHSWAVVRLGSFIELISGQHLTPEEYNEAGEGHPYLTGPADFGERHPVATRWTHADRALARRDDILITVKGAGIGKSNIVATETAFISRQLMAVRPIIVDRDFVHLALRSGYDQFQRQGVGIAIPGIGRDDILHFVVALPPLAEQRRIVGKVDQLLGLCDELAARQAARREARSALVGATLDRLVSARSAAEFPAHAHRLRDHFDRLFDTPTTLPQLRQAILQLAVQGQLVPQDPNDEPASVLIEQIVKFKQDAGGRATKTTLLLSDTAGVPLREGWVAARFGDIMVNRDGERVPVSREIREGRKGPYDYYGASGVIDCIDEFLFDKPLLLIGEDGANLINRSTPIAFIARGKYWVNNHAHVLDGISLDFLRYIELFINAIDLKPYVTGTAQPKMNQAKMNSIPIALPPLSEQKRIVSKVTELLSLCDALEAKLTQAESASTQLLSAAVHHLLLTSP